MSDVTLLLTNHNNVLTAWVIDTGDVICVEYEAILAATGKLGRWKRVIAQLRTTARSLVTFIDVCTKATPCYEHAIISMSKYMYVVNSCMTALRK